MIIFGEEGWEVNGRGPKCRFSCIDNIVLLGMGAGYLSEFTSSKCNNFYTFDLCTFCIHQY